MSGSRHGQNHGKRKRNIDPIADTASTPRTLQACYPCRRRKVKCNGIRPVCNHCQRLNDDCSWPPSDFSSLTSPFETLAVSPELSRDQGEILLRIFFETPHLAIVRQSIHRPTFESTAFDDQPTFLRTAICALAALYLTPHELQDYFRGKTAIDTSSNFARIGQHLSMGNVFSPCIENIQANVFLALRELMAGTGTNAWMYTGLAIRMAQELRLGKEYHRRHPPREREIRRRIMWTCFIMDCLVCFVTSRPQSIHSTKITLQLPCPETAFVFEEAVEGQTIYEFTHAPTVGSDVMLYFIKATELWGAVVDHFATRAVGPAEYSIESEGWLLSAETDLENWMRGLPQKMQWSPQNYRSHKIVNQGNIFVSFHLLILHARCFSQQRHLPLNDLLDLADPKSQIAVEKCLQAADEISEIVALLTTGDEGDLSNLFSPFAGLAIMGSACIYIWRLSRDVVAAAMDWQVDAAQRPQIEEKLQHLYSVLRSWSNSWTIVQSWLETLMLLSKFYSIAYGTESLESEASSIHEVETTTSPQQVTVGSGFPIPADTGHNWRTVYLLTSAVSETPALRRQQARLHTENLWKQMWSGSQLDISAVFPLEADLDLGLHNEDLISQF